VHVTGDPAGRTIPVLAAVIRRDGRFLVARRPLEKRHGGLWEFPGGKMGPAESMVEAADRELREELALRATGVGRVLFEARDPGSPFLIRFVEVEATGEPQALEHLEVGWYQAGELTTLSLAPTDALFVREWVQDDRKEG
jgi:8-oxo-dGTP diphosphatase